MVSSMERPARHRFIRMNPAPDLILQTNRLHAEVTSGQIRTGTVNPMKGSVHVKGGDLTEILKIRTWTEMLFPIPGTRPVAGDEKTIAQKLRDLKIGNYLKYLHEESDQPFRYRIELKSQTIPREKRGEFISRIASRLDALEKGTLQNTDSGYEVELRLIERKDKSFIPLLKLFTIPDRRYAYRKETTAQSTSASLAALAVELARPYLKDGAQLLDPFCGTGLRDRNSPDGEMYCSRRRSGLRSGQIRGSGREGKDQFGDLTELSACAVPFYKQRLLRFYPRVFI